MNNSPMKIAVKTTTLIGLLFIFSANQLNAQNNIDSSEVNKEYNNLEEALKNPKKVHRLNLGNQNLSMLQSPLQKED